MFKHDDQIAKPDTQRSYDIFAPAKVNLRLKIEGVRPDGYHLLSMLNVVTDFCDHMILRFNHEGRVSVSCSEADLSDFIQKNYEVGSFCRELCDSSKNLAARAASLFLQRFAPELGLDIHLRKKIPPGAGLGGGSSDAAAILKFLAQYFGSRLKDKNITAELQNMAVQLGADVPFLLSRGFAVVSGVGEKVQELEPELVHGMPLLIILPGIFISTAEIFKITRLYNHETFSQDEKLLNFCKHISSASPQELADLIENDLNAAAIQYAPKISEVFKIMSEYPDLVTSLSGSGSALFAISRKPGVLTPQLQAELQERLQPLNIALELTLILPE